MSKKIRYPNGYIGTVSDKVAEILAAKPGHAIVRDRPDSPEAARARAQAAKAAKEALNG